MNPALFARVLGIPLSGALREKYAVGVLKHFGKFTGINLRLIFDKLAIKLPTKIVGLKFSYVSCLEVVSSRSHNS